MVLSLTSPFYFTSANTSRIAHSFGRPSHINRNDWNVPILTYSDFHDDDRPDCNPPPTHPGMHLFLNMASLTLILSDCLESLLYLPSSFCRTHEVQHMLSDN